MRIREKEEERARAQGGEWSITPKIGMAVKARPAGVGEEGNAGGLEFVQATDLGAVRGTWEESQIRGNRGKRVQRDEKRRMTRYQTLPRSDPR